MNTQNRIRQPAGIPVGGQFATENRSRSSVQLNSACGDPEHESDEPIRVGADPRPIPVAEARRALPEGSRVQVIYLNDQRPGDDGTPDVRTVTKQNATEMTTSGPAIDGKQSHLRWAKQKVERDAGGAIIVDNESGLPYVAYVPLADGQPGIENLDIYVPAAAEVDAAQHSDDPIRLHALVGNDRVVVRQLLAKNPNTATATLSVLAGDSDQTVRESVARHPNTGREALVRLATDPVQSIQYNVALNPKSDTQVLDRLAVGSNHVVREVAARHPNMSAARLEAMAATERNFAVRGSIASHPHTHPAVLERYANSDGHTMAQVAANPNTPAHVLTRMSHDTATGNQCRAMAAGNPNTPAADRQRLVASEDYWIRQHAADNPSLSPHEVSMLASDQDERVRRALAGNPLAGRPAMQQLARDADSFVRAAAARNPAMPLEHLEVLARDESHNVRSSVARNPKTPEAIVRRLAAEDGAVGQWAQRILAERGS